MCLKGFASDFVERYTLSRGVDGTFTNRESKECRNEFFFNLIVLNESPKVIIRKVYILGLYLRVW